jgi:hypothetical protein
MGISESTYNVSDMTGGVLPWRDELLLPGRMNVVVDEKASPYMVILTIAVEASEPVLESVIFTRRKGGPPVSPRLMRQIAIGEHLQAIANLMAFRPVGTLENGAIGYERVHEHGGSFALTPDDVSAPGRPSRITDAHLKEVAAVYNAAVEAGSTTPRKAVRQDPRWSPIPAQTAARWIRAAKDKGYVADPEGASRPAADSTKSTQTATAKRTARSKKKGTL